MRLDPASGELETYASGIRNTLGFDWHPVDQRMWFTENGQDDLGDYLPPDEINLVEAVGQDFGFPFYYGSNVEVRMPGGAVAPTKVAVPKVELTAHTAPLGVTFYRGQQFPSKYRNALFVAEHGSSGVRNVRVGFRLAVVRRENDSIKYEPFTSSWTFATLGSVLRGKRYVWGRPTDIAEANDGSLLISDDAAGAIYRLSYEPE
jgi:glucose/arabinose dehydrogenase